MLLIDMLRQLPKNKAEARFKSFAIANGWIPLKKGWPDYLLYNPETEEVIAVEVKPDDSTKLDNSQTLAVSILSSKLPCYRWSNDGFTNLSHPISKTLFNVLLTEKERLDLKAEMQKISKSLKRTTRRVYEGLSRFAKRKSPLKG